VAGRFRITHARSHARVSTLGGASAPITSAHYLGTGLAFEICHPSAAELRIAVAQKEGGLSLCWGGLSSLTVSANPWTEQALSSSKGSGCSPADSSHSPHAGRAMRAAGREGTVPCGCTVPVIRERMQWRLRVHTMLARHAQLARHAHAQRAPTSSVLAVVLLLPEGTTGSRAHGSFASWAEGGAALTCEPARNGHPRAHIDAAAQQRRAQTRRSPA